MPYFLCHLCTGTQRQDEGSIKNVSDRNREDGQKRLNVNHHDNTTYLMCTAWTTMAAFSYGVIFQLSSLTFLTAALPALQIRQTNGLHKYGAAVAQSIYSMLTRQQIIVIR